MSRLVLAAASALIFFSRAPAAGQAATPAPAPKNSIIFSAHDPQAIDRFTENPAVTRRMVDQLVMAVTGQSEIGQAWRTLVSAKDRIGIKVAAAGAPYFSSRRGVVEAILAGLESSGVPRRQVIVWDRDTADLRRAGFDAKRLGCEVRSIEPASGYDKEAMFTAPVLGKLIWGDLLFTQKAQKVGGKLPKEGDQLSSSSYIAKLVSKEITKVINVPVITDGAGAGIAGALYNMTVPNVDNWRRFTQTDASATEALASLYEDERVGAKVVITIMDGLLAQYAGGPRGNPNYAFAHATVYASRDPVALDATAFRLIEGWRAEAKLPPIGGRAAWLKSAEELGLGNFAAERIVIQEVTPPVR
ncbi:MAG TPA: DUF362 domain-containing protein [Chthoniobacteraceae bacterium]|jgi:hypothetical protein